MQQMKQIQKHILIITLVVLTGGTAFAQIQTDVPALKDVYANDFYIGCLLSYKHVGFPSDPVVPGQSSLSYPNGDGGYLIKFHMNSMSPGNNMKPQYTVDLSGSASAYAAASTQAAKDSIDIHPIIKFNGDLIAQLNWAQRQGFTFRGHTLVWYNQTPGPAFFYSGYNTTSGTRLSKEKMTQRMENYIKEVIRLVHENWPGLLSAFDVVNEAVNENGTDRTANNEWYTTFGDNSYIMKAFEFARKYTVEYDETQIKLYYNDYNTHNSAKADGIVRVCGPIFRAGYLDGIGMQEHDGLAYPTAEQWIASYNKFDTICTEMAVTELDVKTGSTTPSATLLAKQANQYAQLFKCFVERSYRSGRGKIINVSKDGLNDQYTFVNEATSLWDANNQCKPAFYSVVNVGLYYNILDSLISYADTLKEDNYTPTSWQPFSEALMHAKQVRDSNFSVNVPADTALMNAKEELASAIDGLVKQVSAVKAPTTQMPYAFNLNQNYPNPFNPTTRIEFSLPEASTIELELYDVLGKQVLTIAQGMYSAGAHQIVFNGSNLASGIYFYKLQTGQYFAVKKLTILK
jgi:endo-1,4-beta-xylanase